MIKKFKAFTLIELLVVIVIIGILASLTAIGLNSIRGKARDSRRIADIKQIQTALELYFSENNTYPAAGTSAGMFAVGKPLISSSSPSMTYIKSVPTNPTPVTDGGCAAGTQYSYSQMNSGANYNLEYCLGAASGDVSGGKHAAVASHISGGFVCGDLLLYNGINYNTVLIGSQCWFKENLAVTSRPSGNVLVKNSDYYYVQKRDLSNLEEPVLTDMVNGSTSVLGYLYSWAVAMDLSTSAPDCNATSTCVINTPHQGLCPSGWHIPSEADWSTVENFLKDSGQVCSISRNGYGCIGAGSAMKEVGTSSVTLIPFSSSNSDATNSSGFSVRAAGYYGPGFWGGRGTNARFQSATQFSTTPETYIRYRFFMNTNTAIYASDQPKIYFVSVRCLKD